MVAAAGHSTLRVPANGIAWENSAGVIQFNWQRAHVLAAVAFLRDLIDSGDTRPETRATYEGLLDVLEPARRVRRLHQQALASPGVTPDGVTERRSGVERRIASERRSGHERRQHHEEVADDRRAGLDRRSGVDRRSGIDRRRS